MSFKWCTFGAIFCVTTLLSATRESYLAFEDGFRVDKTNNRVVLTGVGLGVRTSTQSATKLKSYQTGAVGEWILTDFLYVIGTGHYGWVFDGQYREAYFRGKTEGTTADASLGIGYMFPLVSCWNISPVLGWSYDMLNLTAIHATHPIPINNEIKIFVIGDICSKSTFLGPWVGFILQFLQEESWNVQLAYELHHAHWHATRNLPRELGAVPFGTTTGFSNVRNHNNLWGNVFEFGSTFEYDFGFIGMNLQYQFWQSIGYGTYKRTATPLPPAITKSVITNVEWDSFAAMVEFGFIF